MLNIILMILILILISVIIGLTSILKVQLYKIKIYETWLREIKEDVNNTFNEMQKIDIKGTFASSMNNEGLFESDDEVGKIFLSMKDLIEKLDSKVE